MNVLDQIHQARRMGDKLLAILIDPDKVNNTRQVVEKLKHIKPNFVFVGGSHISTDNFDTVVSDLKNNLDIPVVLFPGDASQISDDADAILLLSLISGRNPEYLIGQHIKAAFSLKEWNKEVIPTSYILIDGGNETSVQRVSQTTPIAQMDIELIRKTALAGAQLGQQLVYLEAGSGAKISVSENIIKAVVQEVNLPLIVGGGIRNREEVQKAWDHGATVVVVGTAFENDSF